MKKAPSTSILNIADFAGSWLVIYFYPKDDTPGCTKEACSFRDVYAELISEGIKLVGISKDTATSHEKFAAKFQLPFPLLADPTLETIKAYGAWGKKSFMGRTFDGVLRHTYIVNPKGEIVHTFEKVKPEGHAQEVLETIRTLRTS